MEEGRTAMRTFGVRIGGARHALLEIDVPVVDRHAFQGGGRVALRAKMGLGEHQPAGPAGVYDPGVGAMQHPDDDPSARSANAGL